MTELQSSEAILNDLFSSFENNCGQKRSEDDGTEDDDSDSDESVQEKVPEVSSDYSNPILPEIYPTRLSLS